MKRLIYGSLFLATVGIGLFSCKKENVGNSIINSKENITNEKHIPTFKNLDELNERLEFLSKMNEDERRIYEKENNYKSLLTKVYEIYEGVDLENLKSQSELKSYVDQYQSILSLKTDINNEFEYRPYFSDNNYSVIANENRLFILGDACIKVFDDGVVSTDKYKKHLLLKMNNISVENILQTDEIFISKFKMQENLVRASCHPTYNEKRETNNKERTKLFVAVAITVIGADDFTGLTSSSAKLYGRIRPYKKTLGIWYHARRTISGRIKATASFSAFGNQVENLSINTNYSSKKSYSVTASDSKIKLSVAGLSIKSIDSWGDTPSTSTATIYCN